MGLYRKLTIVLCFSLLINNLMLSQIVSDSLFYYLVANDKKNVSNAISMRLFVHNASSDSVWIANFNRFITHLSAFSFKKTQERIFYWDLLTLSNQKELDVISIMPSFELKTSNKRVEEKNVNIVIPPNSTFVSNIYLLHSPFVAYPKGYYKLCFFDKATNKCLAETIIEIE